MFYGIQPAILSEVGPVSFNGAGGQPRILLSLDEDKPPL